MIAEPSGDVHVGHIESTGGDVDDRRARQRSSTGRPTPARPPTSSARTSRSSRAPAARPAGSARPTTSSRSTSTARSTARRTARGALIVDDTGGRPRPGRQLRPARRDRGVVRRLHHRHARRTCRSTASTTLGDASLVALDGSILDGRHATGTLGDIAEIFAQPRSTCKARAAPSARATNVLEIDSNRCGGGDVGLEAPGDINVTEVAGDAVPRPRRVASTGNVHVTVRESGDLDEDLLLLPGGDVRFEPGVDRVVPRGRISAAGTVVLEAGDDVDQRPPTARSTRSATIDIHGDWMNADPGAGTTIVLGGDIVPGPTSRTTVTGDTDSDRHPVRRRGRRGRDDDARHGWLHPARRRHRGAGRRQRGPARRLLPAVDERRRRPHADARRPGRPRRLRRPDQRQPRQPAQLRHQRARHRWRSVAVRTGSPSTAATGQTRTTSSCCGASPRSLARAPTTRPSSPCSTTLLDDAAQAGYVVPRARSVRRRARSTTTARSTPASRSTATAATTPSSPTTPARSRRWTAVTATTSSRSASSTAPSATSAAASLAAEDVFERPRRPRAGGSAPAPACRC